MGLLRVLFGSGNPSAKPYVDDGLKLTKELITLLNLNDWATGTPVYTEREARAIQRQLDSFEGVAEALGERMQRTVGSEALRRLAGADWTSVAGWDLDGDCPDDWRHRVSTYLKAWAMSLAPEALLEMAQLLALAGKTSEAKRAAQIVAASFPSYAPRYYLGASDIPSLVRSVTIQAKEIISDISRPQIRLHGLNNGESVLAIWKLLFSPALQKHFGSNESLDWTKTLIANFAEGKQEAFSAQYNRLLPEVKMAGQTCSKHSMSNPPWSMVSLDMRVGLIPWVTPAFDEGLAILLKTGSALEKHFGDVLPIAYFLHGGPGDSPETAFRVCAPTNAVRASAEHWLMRAYLRRNEEGPHATVGLDDSDRTFSVHHYTDINGDRKKVCFETTDVIGREEDDFRDFLNG